MTLRSLRHIQCVVLLVASLSLVGCEEQNSQDEMPTADMNQPTQDVDRSINGQSDATTTEDASESDAASSDMAMPSTDAAATDTATTQDMNSTPPQTCERTNDCPTPLVCNLGECLDTTPCSTDADCTELGTICNRGRMRCVLGCRVATDCPMDDVCGYNRCVTGTRCSRDSDCNPNQECERVIFPGRCVDRAGALPPDMGMAPDGGIWTCNGEQCDSRQRCGPHPSSQCEAQTCLGAHGGVCESNCDCQVSLICRQNINRCVACLNSLQCDAPEICIPTGQCGVRVNLDEGEPTTPLSLRILRTLRDCNERAQFGGCGQFTWTLATPQLETLRLDGCGDSIYANAPNERDALQDLLRCGNRESPLFVDPGYSGVDSGMVCVTRHRGLFWFHNCREAAVPID